RAVSPHGSQPAAQDRRADTQPDRAGGASEHREIVVQILPAHGGVLLPLRQGAHGVDDERFELADPHDSVAIAIGFAVFEAIEHGVSEYPVVPLLALERILIAAGTGDHSSAGTPPEIRKPLQL